MISGQIPALMKATLRDGYTSLVGNGQGCKSHVHIEDVGTFYELILGQLLMDKSVPYGREGIFFVGSGYQSYEDISRGIAKAATELGIIENEELTLLTVNQAVEKLNWSKSEMGIELAFVSRSVALKLILTFV
jgi:nucleoside-diphosphate-sugar epimerase